MRFVDLFAGRGGFHLALRKLGYDCAFVCEIEPTLQDLYELNFGMRPHGDIRQIKAKDVPSHEVHR